MADKPTYEELETRIQERTSELREANKQLQRELRKRERIEENLRNALRMRANLLDNIPDCIALILKMGTREIVASNKFARDLGAFPGRECYKTCLGRDHECPFCLASELWETGLLKRREVEYRGKWYDGIWAPLSEDLYLHYIFDISERKLMEAQVRQAHKMESINTIAGGIAHDFNNILYTITGNAELALEDVPEWNPVHANLEEIKTAGLRGAGIVKQLIDFSRKTEPELNPIGAITVIKDALKFLRAMIPAVIEIRANITAKDVTIQADPIQLNQALVNICTNASQAMEATGGVLELAVETTTVKDGGMTTHPGPAPGDYLKITISDTGPGIDPEIIGRIFDPYFTTRDVGKGSGLGLSVVHGIVKNHKGAVSVESEPGKGAAFSVLFPLISNMPEVETKTTDERLLGTETILFVDDEKSIVHMTGRMLARFGYKVKAETDPVEALELFRSKPDRFDLLITDMEMPGMTGVKLLEKARRIRADIPVIVCTGHSPLIDAERAEALGVDAFVLKPVSKRDIAETIRKVIDNS
ncbi:MAG: response regulator [Deltaproteobacteria bacterium]|nr:response regulator [Deltaproteobacteria bacterium]